MEAFIELLVNFISVLAKAGFGHFAIAYAFICAWFLGCILALRTPSIRAFIVTDKTKPILRKFFENNAIVIGGSMAFWLGGLITLMLVSRFENYILILTGQTQEKMGNLFLLFFAACFLGSFLVTWFELKAEKPSEKTKPESSL